MKINKIILIFIIFFSCSKYKTYNVKGTIIEIRPIKNEFLIHHDEIPGFMMAMTMPFKLEDSSYINKFNIGDSVQFQLKITNKIALSNHFIKLGKGTLPKSNDIWDDNYSPIDIGEILSDVNLLNTDSTLFNLSKSDGKFRLLSYIFTRCPMPNMCPAVIVKNQYLANEFKDNSNIEFIIISFDYNYDTPSILNKTYSNIIESNPNIRILSSYGNIDEIFKIAGQSNVSFWGIEENDIGHSLRSILIDPERRILQAFEGMDWKPEKVKKDLNNIIKSYN